MHCRLRVRCNRCLRNRYRRWTIDDLVDACSETLYEMEGISKGVSIRTVQGDLQIMRSDKLGYNAPIEVYDRIYYRYSDPDYSISDMPLSESDFVLISKAVEMLKDAEKNIPRKDVCKVLMKVKERLTVMLNYA